MTPTDSPVAGSPEQRPSTLNWRFEFGSYGATRQFLDRLSELSKRENFYPDINFAKTYVNISMDAEGQAELGARKDAFVQEMKVHAEQGQA